MAKYHLEIYTRPTCSDCKDLKKFLKKLTGSGIVPGFVFSEAKILGMKRKSKRMTGWQDKEKIKKLIQVG
ncbi:hypothetical protein [Paucisalibacillus sp. EB02]|uniref:hypothetical protein n=1 Tax=Paucisalibacillus sp. EB02 TaxID=1347087 RepID=UPI0004AC92CE|nr:hypothetical protein [Paucisalibacillus sp. EB02]